MFSDIGLECKVSKRYLFIVVVTFSILILMEQDEVEGSSRDFIRQ